MVPPDMNGEGALRAVFVVGPTAGGKTAAAHALADADPSFALVNLDAFQFYRGVSAGTAKPSPGELARYGYALVDVLDPPDRFDARRYAALALETGRAAAREGRVPLFVGGSGLYLRALLHGLDDLPSADPAVRERLRARAAVEGWRALHAELARVDPVRAAELHANDSTRIERALEVHEITGKPMSEGRTRCARLRDQAVVFDPFVVHVEPGKEWLRQRIASRTRALVGDAWYGEVEGLSRAYGDALAGFQCMQAIGYPLILSEVKAGRPRASEAVAEEIAAATWRYARRQRTWNAKETRSAAFDPSREGELPAAVAEAVVRFAGGGGSKRGSGGVDDA